MRLLFDEQLSEDLSKLLHDVFPDSLHIRQIGASGATDGTVWQLAREHGCLLVTKDEDFHRLSILLAAPPKVVWIRLETAARKMLQNCYGNGTPIFNVSPNKTKPHSWALG